MEFFEMFGGGLANIPVLPIRLAVHGDCCFTWGALDFRREPLKCRKKKRKVTT
jgi:hypothetical protein